MKNRIPIYVTACVFLTLLLGGQSSLLPDYPWLARYDAEQSITTRIKVPLGYKRVETAVDSFAHWLRMLPLKKGCPPVHLFDGNQKDPQTVHAAVIDMDVGRRDLQQCADAVIRLRSEYLFSRKEISKIAFNFTSGHRASLTKWQQGFRPRVRGSQVIWSKTAGIDKSYRGFRQYLNTVFMYAGSYSLSRELLPVPSKDCPRIGDVFIASGFPGHAVMVVDLAVGEGGDGVIMLLAQSYMPAQEVHLLRNPNNHSLSPWYRYQPGKTLVTPEWSFDPGHLKRFK